jgi:hypothetical protein
MTDPSLALALCVGAIALCYIIWAIASERSVAQRGRRRWARPLAHLPWWASRKSIGAKPAASPDHGKGGCHGCEICIDLIGCRTSDRLTHTCVNEVISQTPAQLSTKDFRTDDISTSAVSSQPDRVLWFCGPATRLWGFALALTINSDLR